MRSSKIIALAETRRLLEERFPTAQAAPERAWDAGSGHIEGAILLGAIAEVCGETCCGRLWLDRVLATARRRGEWVGVVEAGSSFDFQCDRGAGWEKVVVVCARDAEMAVKAADLLLRDGNLPLVLLDLQTAPVRSLGRIPANVWHRFQRLVERSGTALVVLTPQPLVEAARVRIALRGRWGLEAMRRPRGEVIAELDVQVFRRGRGAQIDADPLWQSA